MPMASADLEREIEEQSGVLQRVRAEVGKVVVGQTSMVDRLLLALIADGHVLIEGIPGLAKTTAIKTLADCVAADFSRIQFTPDLLPADLVGTQIYRPGEHAFEIKPGPVFTNLLLADEINRAPAKVQSALLEAMQERQVTIGEHDAHQLPDPFVVLATQNPIEQEGTYPLAGGSDRSLHAEAAESAIRIVKKRKRSCCRMSASAQRRARRGRHARRTSPHPGSC